MTPDQAVAGWSTRRSAELADERRGVLPHGVTGDGRGEDEYPVVFERAQGQYLFDVDGNRFLDLHGGYGTAVLGYAHPEVDARVEAAIGNGRAFIGVANVYEARYGERLCELLPEAERVAFCGGGGTDAIYHAVRIARAVTRRPKVVKFEGGYHGWQEVLGASTRPPLDDLAHVLVPETIPNSAGVLPASIEEIVVVNANDEESLYEAFRRHGAEIAAVVIEPVMYSLGCVEVDDSYIQLARRLCDEHEALLVFDEILSGFRRTVGSAGARSCVVPDIAAYGKAAFNGYIGSFLTGRGDLIDQLSPGGPVFYSGTFNGHPVSMAAGEATLDVLRSEDRPLERASALAARIADSTNATIAEHGLQAACQQSGSVLNLFLGTTQARGYRDIARALKAAKSGRLNATLRFWLRDRGIFMQRRIGTNRCFISGAHTDADADQIAEAFTEFLREHAEDLRV